jgi:release factor glutamine methyltransferase
MNEKIAINSVGALLDYIETELSGMYDARERQNIASWLFAAFNNWSRSELIVRKEDRLSESEILKYHFATKRLKTGEPVQYVVGEVDFIGIKLRVNPSVLIPRPETEELVQYILDENGHSSLRVLDIGTGSGCIPIALKMNRPSWDVQGIDKSVNTLNTAEANARLHSLDVRFKKMDIFESLEFNKKFDILVSNPPYVLESDKASMSSQVVNHEPSQALFVPDNDPLIFYRRMLDMAAELLNPQAKIYFEIHENQAAQMLELASSYPVTDIKVTKDMQGKDRIISMTYSPN